MSRFRHITQYTLLAMALLLPDWSGAFPLDGAATTGITRLEGYRLAQLGQVPGNKLPAGAMLKLDQIKLRLTNRMGQGLPMPDARLSRRLTTLLGEDAKNYSLSLLDITDPAHPRYAEHQAAVQRNPGSVGKLVIALSLFQTLADLHPDDTEARERLLRNTIVVADDFIRTDHHRVPFWQPEKKRLRKRRLVEGDSANLWSWLDWMLSASSNAAASMVLKQVLLLRHFGRLYPPGHAAEDHYFNHTPKQQLSRDLLSALQQPLIDNGFDTRQFRQGGFFSHTGKRRVPGGSSTANSRQLMRYLLLMEQGKLVDRWSSLQIKRLLYLTRRRIRYASSPALKDAAVYFKSGSFYKCRAEAGFVCNPYTGNVLNLMNSVTEVEWPAGAPKLVYMVVVTSNVLRKNSAVAQQTLATRLHRLMQRMNP